jgi:hypothetical protein
LVAARENNALASQDTMADALFSASFFNACLRPAEDVGMANIAPSVNDGLRVGCWFPQQQRSGAHDSEEACLGLIAWLFRSCVAI